MGGEIEVNSQLNKGSVFSFRLDLHIASSIGRMKPGATPFDKEAYSAPLRILVAEDNPVNRLLATKLLAKLGHDVAAVENGRKAIEMLNKEHFDLIFMDVQMPIMDGLEAANEIKNDHSGKFYSRIPIIAMTAHAMKGDQERFLEAGMDDYISKPIDKNELAAVIGRVMKNA